MQLVIDKYEEMLEASFLLFKKKQLIIKLLQNTHPIK